MHLRRNFAWTLELSDRELKVIVKVLKDEEELTEDELPLVDKLTNTLEEMSIRLERLNGGRSFRHARSDRRPDHDHTRHAEQGNHGHESVE